MGDTRIQESLLAYGFKYEIPHSETIPEFVANIPDWGILRKLMLEIMQAPIIGVDTETAWGTDPFNGSQVRLLQLCYGENKTIVFDFFKYNEDQKKYICNLLLKHSSGIKVFHNSLFDLMMLRKYAKIDINGFKLFDTQVAEKILDCGLNRRGFALADLTDKYLDIKLDKTEQVSNWEVSELSPEQLIYAKKDAEVTYQLYFILAKLLEENNLTKPFFIDMKAIPAIVECINSGIYLDFKEWENIANELQQKANELEIQIKRMFAQESINIANLNSPPQLKEALTKLNTGVFISSTSMDFFKQIEHKHPIFALLIEFKVISKKLSSFGEKYEKYRSSLDGRIHPRYTIATTATGRLSCKNPNIQQVPREARYRQCFKAEKNNILIKADYSQIELRIAAHLSQDPVMLDAFKTGKDLHALTAAKVANVPMDQITKEQRKQAKSINFGFLYSMGSEHFKEYAKVNFGVDVTLGQAEVFKMKFFETYPGLKSWHKSLDRKNYSITLGGRIRKYDKDYFTGESYNTPVQGTGADILKVALHKVNQMVLNNELRPTKMVAIVHDEIVVECDKKDVDKVSAELKNQMILAWKEFITDVDIDVDIKIGEGWGG